MGKMLTEIREINNRIRLIPLNKKHEKDLFQFELENRSYFETMVPSRGDSYYLTSHFKDSLDGLLAEQMNKQGYYFVLVNKSDKIIGRLNLVKLEDQRLEVGYRIGENYIGKGFAKEALSQAIKLVKTNKWEQILIAKTTSANIGSQRVLERNGFTFLGNDKELFEWKGQIQHFVYYQFDINVDGKSDRT